MEKVILPIGNKESTCVIFWVFYKQCQLNNVCKNFNHLELGIFLKFELIAYSFYDKKAVILQAIIILKHDLDNT